MNAKMTGAIKNSLPQRVSATTEDSAEEKGRKQIGKDQWEEENPRQTKPEEWKQETLKRETE